MFHDACRQGPRSQELQGLLAEGKIPHDVELQKHPEMSVTGISCEFIAIL